MNTLETTTNFDLLSDIGLLELLCSQTDDRSYFTEFVNRFLPEMLLECNRVCKARKLDSHIGKQIAHEVFERVRKYKSFRLDKVKMPLQRNAILVYLNRISISLFNDYYKKEKREINNHRSYFDDIMDLINPTVDVQGLKNKKDIAMQIYGKLNKKEQRVVIVDIEHKKNKKYLPDDVNTSLAQELGVKPATVRKIRERAVEKLKKEINEINNAST